MKKTISLLIGALSLVILSANSEASARTAQPNDAKYELKENAKFFFVFENNTRACLRLYTDCGAFYYMHSEKMPMGEIDLAPGENARGNTMQAPPLCSLLPNNSEFTYWASYLDCPQLGTASFTFLNEYQQWGAQLGPDDTVLNCYATEGWNFDYKIGITQRIKGLNSPRIRAELEYLDSDDVKVTIHFI